MEIHKEKLKGIHGGRILDAATGRGNFIQVLADSLESYDEIIGIDSADAPIEAARANFNQDNIKFLKMDASHMEFESCSFDMVCISNSLHHLSDLYGTLMEIKRVLKPGGLYIINEMYSDNQSEARMTHVYMHHWWAEIDRSLGINHGNTFTRREIVDIAGSMRFGKMEILDFAWPEDDAKDEDSIREMVEVTDNYIEKAKGLPDFEYLRQKGEELKKRLRSIGISSAEQLIIIGKK
jgi:SAM-dependent methyltransferase